MMTLKDLTGDRLTEAEQAILRHDEWHANIDTRMGVFESDMNRIEGKLDSNATKIDDNTVAQAVIQGKLDLNAAKIDANTVAQAVIQTGTTELLMILKSWQGAMRVFSWISKPITVLATLAAAIAGLWYTVWPRK